MNQQKIDAYIIGGGSIGLFTQYFLQKKVNSLLLVKEKTYEKLQKNQLKISGKIEESSNINCQIFNATTVNFTPAAPIFIATKVKEALSLLEELKTKIPNESPIILCQNGIGIYDHVEKLNLPNPILRLISWLGVTRLDLDHIKVSGIDRYDLSGDSQDLKLINKWQQILESTGVRTTASSKPYNSEWRKALVNLVVNGICSLINKPNGEILKSEELKAIARNIINESVKVAELEGVIISKQDIDTVYTSIENTSTNINASLQDLRAGRSTEVDYLNGAVVSAARKHGASTPANEIIMNFIKYLEKI